MIVIRFAIAIVVCAVVVDRWKTNGARAALSALFEHLICMHCWCVELLYMQLGGMCQAHGEPFAWTRVFQQALYIVGRCAKPVISVSIGSCRTGLELVVMHWFTL